MNIDPRPLIVRRGQHLRLAQRPTRIAPWYASAGEYAKTLAGHVKRLDELQEVFYAADRYGLLLILQGMDAAGKDGIIRHVMSGVNPQGVEVSSFKHPSGAELQHDFLWRAVQRLPERGRIGIFNRSYYEEVLITRVHPQLLAGEGLPREALNSEGVWQARYRSIVDLEHHLYRNGTRIVKVFLHLSKGEQRRRFLARIDDPEKNWKFSPDDTAERRFWLRYVKAYEACLSATSSAHAPWYVVPADDKHNARLIVSQILIDTMEQLRLRFPRLTATRRRELAAARRQLQR